MKNLTTAMNHEESHYIYQISIPYPPCTLSFFFPETGGRFHGEIPRDAHRSGASEMSFWGVQ